MLRFVEQKFFEVRQAKDIAYRRSHTGEAEFKLALVGRFSEADHQPQTGAIKESYIREINDAAFIARRPLQANVSLLPHFIDCGRSDFTVPLQ